MAPAVKEDTVMRRFSSVIAVFILLSGCAAFKGKPAGTPFTNGELIAELQKQGVGWAGLNQQATGRSAEDRKPGVRSGTGWSWPSSWWPQVQRIALIEETAKGVMVTLPPALFAFDSADLQPEARLVVDRMAAVLNHPRAMSRKIVLEGHADAIGTEAYNLGLSRRRAETVVQELIVSGVRGERLSLQPYGETRPAVPNTQPDGTDNPAGRAQNRRVETLILNHH
jgi:outer membrane protein OmpA-like peptidoglycan-associated protein